MANTQQINVTGSYTFYFDRSTVWDLLMSPEAIEAALPGVQSMVALPDEGDAWAVSIGFDFVGKHITPSGILRMSAVTPPSSYRLELDAAEAGMQGDVLITLSDDDKRTHVLWEGTATFADTEKSSEMLIGMVQMLSTVMAQQFFMGLAKQLRAARNTLLQSVSSEG
jgi:carbon monoxide dehydrogenase subunit G